MDCSHNNILEINGKCSDLCSVTYPSGDEENGLVPYIEGLGGGDYIHIKICTDCHKVMGLSNSDIKDCTEALTERNKDNIEEHDCNKEGEFGSCSICEYGEESDD